MFVATGWEITEFTGLKALWTPDLTHAAFFIDGRGDEESICETITVLLAYRGIAVSMETVEIS